MRGRTDERTDAQTPPDWIRLVFFQKPNLKKIFIYVLITFHKEN